MYDVLIKGGRILDGSGNPWFRGDIAISNGLIQEIGKGLDTGADRVIDAKGLIIAPGFIDAHSHCDSSTLVHRQLDNVIHQGITTVVSGQCGSSPAPVSEKSREQAQRNLDNWLPPGYELKITWSTFDQYLRLEESEGLGANVAHLVGHGAVRTAAMGFEARAPSDSELTEMMRHVEEAMKSGAYGLSTGLIYPPGIYADTEEIVYLAKVASGHGGVYDSHIRGEGKTLMEALREAIRIGEEAGLPVQISHHKVATKSLWGSSVKTLQMFEDARARGIDITFDQYPYKAGSTSLMTLLPPWVHDGGREKALDRLKDPEQRERMRKEIEAGLPGWENFAGDLGWDNVYVTSVKTDANKQVEGMNMVEVKNHINAPDEFTALTQLLLEEEGTPGMVIFYGDEEDVKRIMRSPLHMVGTDAGSCNIEGPFRKGKPHPRHYGTYPRVLGKYVREEATLRLEEAIRKMTSFPAQRFMIEGRGLIREGFHADLTVFNPDTVIDNSTYGEPHKFPTGIDYVIVNGVVTIDEGKYTGVLAGKTLRKAPKKNLPK